MHQHEPASGKRKRLVPCSRSTSPCCRASCKGAPSPSPQARAVARACHAPWRQSDARAGATSSCSCPHTAIGRKFPRRAQRRRPRESGDASTRWVVLRGSARPRAGAREAVVHAVSIERLAALDLSLGKELRLFRLRGLRSKGSLQTSNEEHRMIAKALQERNSELAGRLFGQHILSGRDRFLSTIEKHDEQARPVRARARKAPG